jgi:hypothetical protein
MSFFLYEIRHNNIKQFRDGWILCKIKHDDCDKRAQITIGIARDWQAIEGDFTLSYYFDGKTIHRLTFAIVPGDIVNIQS